MHSEGKNLLEEIRERRKTILEVIIIASVIGFLLGVSSNALYDWLKGSQITSRFMSQGSAYIRNLWQPQTRNPQDSPCVTLYFSRPRVTVHKVTGTNRALESLIIFMVSGLILVSIILVTTLWVLRQLISKAVNFRILLPIHSIQKFIREEDITGYAPIKYSALMLEDYLKNNPDQKACLSDHLRNDWQKGDSKERFFSYPIYFSVQRTLLILIQKYSEHTLTSSSLYHPRYSLLSWKLKSYEQPVVSLPGDKGGRYFPCNIRLPEGTNFWYTQSSTSPEIHIAEIKSPYCSIVFEILPHWSRITREKARKSYKIAVRNIAETKNLTLLAIPLKVSIKISWKAIFRKKAEDYYQWLSGLLADAEGWLSWELYQQGDTERMLVDIHQKLIRDKMEVKVRKEEKG